MNVRGTGRALWALAMVLLLAAGAPVTSPRPLPRPGGMDPGLEAVLQEILRAPLSPGNGGVVLVSPRPAPRPGLPVADRRDERRPRRGSVCGMRQIRGTPVPAIPGKLAGCGVRQPVRVTEVSGVRLTQAATIDCATARALNEWVVRGVKPAVGRRGGGLAALKVIASYSCRTRNSQPGAKISEHGKGHALDISGIYLKNGDFLSVLEDWNRRRKGRILRAMHDSACGIFGTVLGPDANRFHRDHLHVDTARYRGGAYCR